jgi:glucosamine--fructose-6-phosphate aminotransferase (isomerizing)
MQLERAPTFVADRWPEITDQAGELTTDIMDGFDEILLCGCGDSHHAAVNLEMALAVWTGKPVRARRASQAAYHLTPQLWKQDTRLLVIGISASGEVARTLEALHLAKSYGARTLAITGDRGSSLAHLAHHVLSTPTPEMPIGPGLLNYLGSLMMGYSLACVWSREELEGTLHQGLLSIPEMLDQWIELERDRGMRFAEFDPAGACVFLGSGPLFGTALFAAAKQVEAAGTQTWGQDVEEWAHVEYFCEPEEMPTWLLGAKGFFAKREKEVVDAAKAIGRRLQVSTWSADPAWPHALREALAPMVLWAGPVACAVRRAELLNESPFRGFRGGRSREEGGGPSRIRSSAQRDPARARTYFSGKSEST